MLKKMVMIGLLILLVFLPPVYAKNCAWWNIFCYLGLGSKTPLSITGEGYVSYNKKTFDTCNPCPFNITVSNENHLYSQMLFDIRLNFTSTKIDNTCVPNTLLNDTLGYFNMTLTNWNTSCGVYNNTPVDIIDENGLCQYLNYTGKGSNNCGDCDFSCYTANTTSTDWIELVTCQDPACINTTTIATFDSWMSLSQHIDLATAINNVCINSILACQANASLCTYNCGVLFAFLSNSSSGGVSISTTPTSLTEVTTTTVPTNISTETKLYLNGTLGDFYYPNNTYANFTVTSNASGTVYIYANINNWTVLSGNSPFTQMVLLNATQNNTYYNITGYFSGNVNHKPSSQSHDIIVFTTTNITNNVTTTTTITPQCTKNSDCTGADCCSHICVNHTCSVANCSAPLPTCYNPTWQNYPTCQWKCPNWFQNIIDSIVNFFKKLFNK